MDRILEELVRDTDDATRPDVDLYLTSGPVLRGRVVRVDQGMATVHLGPATDPSVSYVRVAKIIAVTVIGGGRGARSLAPSSGVPFDGPRPPSHHDDIITPINEMSLAAMQAAMATPTPPEPIMPRADERASRRSSDDLRRAASEAAREKVRADKARADQARAELARAEAARVDAARAEVTPADHRSDDVSAAFSAMRLPTDSVPAPDPIAEFVASQYDVITPADPIVPLSLQLAVPHRDVQIEAPTYLGERPQPRAKTPSPAHPVVAPTYIGERPWPSSPAVVSPAAIAAQGADSTFSMRGDTPKPKAPRTPPPSRPELMRQANTHAEMMSRVLGHRVEIAIAAPLDDDARRAIGYALPSASDVLLAMLGEPAYRPVLEGITSIELVAGDAEIALDGPRLVIRCSLVDRWTPASLRAAIASGR